MNLKLNHLVLWICLSINFTACDDKTETAGSETAGTEAASAETAGAETAGSEVQMEEAGLNGNYVPSSEVNITDDLLRTVTLIENVINHAVRQYCDRCSILTSICGQLGQYTDY